jgi:hypothetical protein
VPRMLPPPLHKRVPRSGFRYRRCLTAYLAADTAAAA